MPKIARPAFSPGRFLDIRYSRDFREALDNVSLRDTGVPFAPPALRRARPTPSALGAAKEQSVTDSVPVVAICAIAE
jgi:hypothetical protein